MGDDNHTVSQFFDGASDASNVVHLKQKKNISPHKTGVATAPDGNIREHISLLKLQQQFIRRGFDLQIPTLYQVEDTRHLLESYDARVYHTQYNFAWKIQIKTCYSDRKDLFYIRNISLDDLQNKYKKVPIFVFYVCYDENTKYGLEFRSRIYIIKNIDLQEKIQLWGYRDASRLPLHADDNFWIEHSAKFDIFEEDIKSLNSVMMEFQSSTTNKTIYYTLGELSDAEIVCSELDIEFDKDAFIEFMHKNIKFEKRAFRRYMNIYKNKIEHG